MNAIGCRGNYIAGTTVNPARNNMVLFLSYIMKEISNMKKKTVYAIASIVLVVFTGIAGFSHMHKVNDYETQYISASWAYNYADIEEISQDSDIIALIKVKGPNDTYEINNIPFTQFDVEIIMPIYGASLGEKLNIVMTGGYSEENVTVVILDDPLLKKNEEFLIFARQNEDGTVTILSGPQGRLIHTNGKLNSLTPANSAAHSANEYSNIKVYNADLEDIISEIKAALATEDNIQ